jgi:mannose-6-phosphate isomerase-like protein (cupin superfamily)
MITPQNFQADINNLDALGTMIQLKPTPHFEGGTVLLIPKTFGPALHFHPSQSELLKVVQGELEVFNGKKWVAVQAGEQIYIPKKTTHTYRNSSSEVVVFDFAVTPKIGLTYLLLTIDELVKSGKIRNKAAFKSLVYMSQAVSAFPEVSRSSWPPQFLNKAIAALGEIFGYNIVREKYRATYLRPVKLWEGPRKTADIDMAILEELLF